MDGNGRWAKQKGMPRVLGHRSGVKSVREVTEAAAEVGVQYLTLYAFSTENWSRPPAEVARMPKELQLQILGEFRGLPQQVIGTELDDFGKLERGGRILHRFRVGDYRVYFERHELGVLVHRILNRNTLKDFMYRSGLKVEEDEALQQNPKFWEMIESARTGK